jgi:uncharacterized damage-inducible protein DinB
LRRSPPSITLRRMTYRLFAAVLLSLAVFAPSASAQQPAQQTPPMISASGGLKNLYTTVRGWILTSAEKMPEEHYSFKPTPDVRSFGEILGHVANTQYNFCMPARKVENPNKANIEKTATTKAALVAALKEAFAFCDPAYEMAGDSALSEEVKFGPRPVAAGYTLTFNVAHNFEHYGNLVTYMRLKGLVPPSSDRSGR